MGYRHSRDEILAGATAFVLERGLSELSFGRLAKRLGMADRTVVYYFPTKEQLVGDVLAVLGLQLQQVLADAFGPDPLPPADLARRAWPVLAGDDAARVFAVFFEMNGLAGAGIEPYPGMAAALTGAWTDWVTPRIAAPPARRRAEALALVARVDGLLLVRQILGAEAADQAAAVVLDLPAPRRPRRTP